MYLYYWCLPILKMGECAVCRVCHRYTAGWDFPHHTIICGVSHETHSILIILIIYALTITLHYLKMTGGGITWHGCHSSLLNEKTKQKSWGCCYCYSCYIAAPCTHSCWPPGLCCNTFTCTSFSIMLVPSFNTPALTHTSPLVMQCHASPLICVHPIMPWCCGILVFPGLLFALHLLLSLIVLSPTHVCLFVLVSVTCSPSFGLCLCAFMLIQACLGYFVSVSNTEWVHTL